MNADNGTRYFSHNCDNLFVSVFPSVCQSVCLYVPLAWIAICHVLQDASHHTAALPWLGMLMSCCNCIVQAIGKLSGHWKLLYTVNSELTGLLGLGRLPGVEIGEISQNVIASTLSITNTVTIGGLVSRTAFSAKAAFEIQSPKRIQVIWFPCPPHVLYFDQRRVWTTMLALCAQHDSIHLMFR